MQALRSSASPVGGYPEVDTDRHLPEIIPTPELSESKFVYEEETIPNATTQIHEPVSGQRHQRWTQWPYLILYSLILTLNAGLIGGYIGRAITSDRNSCSIVSDTPKIHPDAPTLSIPRPNCPSDIHEQNVLDNQVSMFSRIEYKTLCGRRWTKDYLIAISSATVSDCAEACASYTIQANTTCAGASYVPTWWNQMLAMEEKDKPFNCFFMGGEDDGIVANEKEDEIVALCLKGKVCPVD